MQHVALIGAGPMAEAYHAVLTHLGVAVTVFGRGDQSAQRFASRVGVAPGTGPLAPQLDRQAARFDAAIVAVGVNELPEATLALLDRDIAKILVEKPGAPTPAQMVEIAARDTGERVRIAYNRRFLRSTGLAREIIAGDGGITSFSFEFTEVLNRVAAANHRASVLQHWVIANSSHVIDMAFDLAGAAPDLSDVAVLGAVARGNLAWHPPGSRFAVCGTVGDAIFTGQADWESGGGWAVELCTRDHRLRLRPLEALSLQRTGAFVIEPVTVPAEPDGLKPGLPGMVRAFLAAGDCRTLPTAKQQLQRMRLYEQIVSHPTE